jgi:uroporphyrinogen-III decarboxylase
MIIEMGDKKVEKILRNILNKPKDFTELLSELSEIFDKYYDTLK